MCVCDAGGSWYIVQCVNIEWKCNFAVVEWSKTNYRGISLFNSTGKLFYYIKIELRGSTLSTSDMQFVFKTTFQQQCVV